MFLAAKRIKALSALVWLAGCSSSDSLSFAKLTKDERNVRHVSEEEEGAKLARYANRPLICVAYRIPAEAQVSRGLQKLIGLAYPEKTSLGSSVGSVPRIIILQAITAGRASPIIYSQHLSILTEAVHSRRPAAQIEYRITSFDEFNSAAGCRGNEGIAISGDSVAYFPGTLPPLYGDESPFDTTTSWLITFSRAEGSD